MPDGLTFIGTESFEGCTSLTSIIIPNTVTELGYAIFYHTTALKYVTIGSEVDTIGALLFAGDTSLISINFTSLIMPLTVDSSWISGCIAPQGHAYQNSIFPIPGQLFNGLLMGSNIPEPAPTPAPPGPDLVCPGHRPGHRGTYDLRGDAGPQLHAAVWHLLEFGQLYCHHPIIDAVGDDRCGHRSAALSLGGVQACYCLVTSCCRPAWGRCRC